MKREIGNPVQADYSHTDALAEIFTFLGRISSVFLCRKALQQEMFAEKEGKSRAGLSKSDQGHFRLP